MGFVNISWCTKPYFQILPDKTMIILNLVIDPSQWVTIIGSFGTSKIDESQRLHHMRNGDVFCLVFTKFHKTIVYNGFQRFVFGLKKPLRNPLRPSVNCSNWTVYSCSLILMNLIKSTFNRGLTLWTSFVLIRSLNHWMWFSL